MKAESLERKDDRDDVRRVQFSQVSIDLPVLPL